MRRSPAWCLAILFAASVVSAEPKEPKGKVILENWDTVYLDGAKAGFVHLTVRELDSAGQKVLRARKEESMTLKRFNGLIKIHVEEGTDETPDGKVLGVYFRQIAGQDQEMVMTGTVRDDQLDYQVNDGNRTISRHTNWNDQVVGLYREESLFREHHVKSGDSFTYLTYAFVATVVVPTRVTVKDEEDVPSAEAKKKQHLLRVEAESDKVGEFQLPPITAWLDKDLATVRYQYTMPGIGKVVGQRSSREVATGKDSATLTDIGLTQLIPVNQPVKGGNNSRAVVYRIRIKGDKEPATAFAQDDRQEVKDVDGDSFELHVQAVRAPQPADNPAEVQEEYLQSCYYIDSDNARVKKLARQAVGEEKDPWKKARRIEKWVHDHMDNSFTEGLITAGQIAQGMKGDCRQHAMLAAALCRAAGVPSRTAMGLEYVDEERGPSMGFHMWTEVYVQGQWIPIDATLGRGSVGADHVKMTDQSWKDVQTPTPFLSLLRVLDKLSIEVISAE